MSDPGCMEESCHAVVCAFREHLELALAVILLVARLADVLSTRWATPQLRLEANPVVRRLGWPFAWATLLLCALPYAPGFGPPVAVAAIVLSLFVAAGNLSRGWAMRALGEEAYREHLRRVVSLATPWQVYGAIALASALIAGAGGLLLLFYPSPSEWAYFFALGIVAYALAAWLYSTLSIRRLLREVARSRPPA